MLSRLWDWMTRRRMGIEKLSGQPLTYLLRLGEKDGVVDVALVKARWVPADETAVWLCCLCQTIQKCEHIEKIEAFREGAGLPRSPVRRAPDDR